uniref:IS30 family transposase n=1 Tax=Acetatifactor sp. TaxID=1872090 RepID=UPI004056AF9C
MAKNLTYTERIKIETMLKDGLTQREIATRLNRHYNTINYEIKRGLTQLRDGATWLEYDYYSAEIGQKKHDEHNANKGRDLKIGNDYAFVHHVEDCIVNKHYSPYAALQTAKGKFKTDICLTTLYHYIDSGIFLNVTNKHLPIKKNDRKTSYNAVRTSYKNLRGKSIEERPKAVNERDTFGHWELDTVVGGKGKSRACLMVLTERKSRNELIMKLASKTMEEVVRAFNTIESLYGAERFKETFKTITSDNGVEFLDAEGIEKSQYTDEPRTTLYYCHPYCSSERGSNENQNKLIRRFCPKGCDFADYTDEQIQEIQEWINNYPRKLFNGLSSNQYIESFQ